MFAELDPRGWSPHTLDLLIALGTVGAVVVAVLSGLLYRLLGWNRTRRTRPLLSLHFDSERDLAYEAIQVTAPSGEYSDPTARMYGALYARLRVENETGRQAATGVEVIVAEIMPLEPSGSIDSEGWRTEPIRSFGPLGWTHTEPPALTIGPGSVRTVDLGMVVDMAGDTTFHVGLKVQPVSGLHNLWPGKYDITLRVAATNMDAQEWSLRLEYDGLWMSGEKPEEHLKITNLRRVPS